MPDIFPPILSKFQFSRPVLTELPSIHFYQNKSSGTSDVPWDTQTYRQTDRWKEGQSDRYDELSKVTSRLT